MLPTAPQSCPHERRPGTTVCLRCLREQRAAASARRRESLVRIGVAAGAVVVVIAAGLAGVNALQARRATADPARPAAPGGTLDAQVVAQQGTPDAPPAAAPIPTPVPSPAIPAADSVARPVAVAPAAAKPPLAPIIAAGRTELGGGVYAERGDSAVVVNFDTPDTRTRRRDKLETIVRATLPRVYGPAADSLLAAIPVGSLTQGRDVVGVLPNVGIHLPLAGGWTLDLWPGTRAGQDGPLAVTYRAVVRR